MRQRAAHSSAKFRRPPCARFKEFQQDEVVRGLSPVNHVFNSPRSLGGSMNLWLVALILFSAACFIAAHKLTGE